jgi:hypothetical protein
MATTTIDVAPEHSSVREKLLEHLFIGDLLRCLWRRDVRDMEVLRAEVDRGGYDLVLEANSVIRYVQLKTTHSGGKTRTAKISLNLARKPGGCVIWMRFDPKTLTLGPFLWFGGQPGQELPSLGEKIGLHTKANKANIKAQRPNIRVVANTRFKKLMTIEDVADALFGRPPSRQGSAAVDK